MPDQAGDCHSLRNSTVQDVARASTVMRPLENRGKSSPQPKNTINAHKASPGYLPSNAGCRNTKWREARPAAMVARTANAYPRRLRPRNFGAGRVNDEDDWLMQTSIAKEPCAANPGLPGQKGGGPPLPPKKRGHSPQTTANRWRGEAYGNSKAGWQSDALRVTDPRSDCACRRLGAVRGCAQKEGWTLAQIIDLIKHRGFPRAKQARGTSGEEAQPLAA